MQRLKEDGRLRWIVLTVTIVSVLYYLSSLGPPVYQEVSTRLFYFPIFLGGLWFGFGGGVRVSLAVTVICLPHLFHGFWPDRTLLFDEVLEVLLFNVFGPIWGYLTDRERRQRAVNQELETLAALGEAAATVAHEIKNVVIPIRYLLGRMRQSQALEERTVAQLKVLEQEAARLEKMTHDMLHFAGHAPLHLEETNVRGLVDDVVHGLEGAFREKGVLLAARYEGERACARMDGERMRQVLVNLLQNALHATSEGNEVRVLVSCDPEGLRIVVEDDGAGIPEAERDRIFLAFFTTKKMGTGLGLAITKRIVEEHGGDIRVESRVGIGTRIAMSFPASAGASNR